jgi:hypothetical protein
VDQPQTFRSTTALVVWVVWLLFAVGNWIDLAVQGRDHSSVVAAAILLMATGVAYVTALRPRVLVDDAGLTIKNPVRDHRISWAAVTDVDLMDLLRVHCTLPQAQGQGERRKVISSWAIHYSRRRQYSNDTKARRAAARTAGGSRPSLFGGGLTSATRSMSYGVPGPSAPSARSSTADTEAEAKLIVRLISERATAARAEALWTASTTTPGDTTTSTEAAPSRAAAPASTATAASAAASTRLLTSTWSTRAIAALVIPALILLIVILL